MKSDHRRADDPNRTRGVCETNPEFLPEPTGSPHQRLSAGKILAERYRIVRFIAEGGMGEVYEAEDLELGERIALKTIRPTIAEQPDIIERFKREIQLARKVTHRNVCRIFDLGHHRAEEEGRDLNMTFLTMELLDGETLASRITRLGKIAPSDAIPIVQQIVAALSTAHEAKIVHRDLKCANVILSPTEDGERVVVTDFGLARGSITGHLEASITDSGAVVGTPAYMAPEQLEGGKITPAVDTYALGIVMYEMVTGEKPFTGDNPISVAVQRLKVDPPPPTKSAPNLDTKWDKVILRCLQRDPSQRFANIADVTKALRDPSVATGPRESRKAVWGVAVTLAIVLAAIGYFVYHFFESPSSDPFSLSNPLAVSAEARPSVVVLGFKNLGNSDADWLGTALSEMLRTELATGEELLCVPGESVARMKLELSVANTDSLAADTLGKVQANLGADFVVLGSYLALDEGRKIRLDLRLQETTTGGTVFSAAETGTVDDLFDLVTKGGEELRRNLGVGEISLSEAGGIRASLPASTEASKLYALGLVKLRVFEALAARDLLEQAALVEPTFPLVHSSLASAWSALGYVEKASSEAKLAFELSKELSREERLSIEGLYYEVNDGWEKAVEIYSGLFVFFPDNLTYGLRLAAAQISGGKAEDALTTVATLRSLPPPISNDPRIDLAEAEADKALTNFERQLEAARRAADKAKARGASLVYAEARRLEGSAQVNLGQLAEARRLCNESQAVFGSAGDRANLARTESLVGVSLAMEGDLDGARERFVKSLETFQEIGNRSGEADQLVNLGNVTAAISELDEAEKLYRRSLEVSRDINDKSRTGKALNNLGATLYEKNDLDDALVTYNEALRLWTEIGEERSVATVLFNIGEILHKQGNLDLAEKRYLESRQKSRQQDDKEYVAEVQANLAGLYLERADLEKAGESLEDALVIYREMENKTEEAQILQRLGELAERQGQTAAAEKLFEQVAAIEKELTDTK